MYRYIWKIVLTDSSSEAAFIEHWRGSSELIQTYKGALGTHLHRVRDEPGSFFAVADWESQAARDAMSDAIHNEDTDIAKQWREFPENDTFGKVISFAGEEIGVVFPT